MPSWRSTNPETSKDAALSISEAAVTDTQKRLLELLSRFPATDQSLREMWIVEWAVADWPTISDSGLRSRRAELVAMGLVVDSGARATLPSGRKAVVWKIA